MDSHLKKTREIILELIVQEATRSCICDSVPCNSSLFRIWHIQTDNSLLIHPKLRIVFQIWKGTPETIQSTPSFCICISEGLSPWKKETSRPYVPSFSGITDSDHMVLIRSHGSDQITPNNSTIPVKCIFGSRSWQSRVYFRNVTQLRIFQTLFC